MYVPGSWTDGVNVLLLDPRGLVNYCSRHHGNKVLQSVKCCSNLFLFPFNKQRNELQFLLFTWYVVCRKWAVVIVAFGQTVTGQVFTSARKNIVAQQWMLWLMSDCRACSPFVCSEPAGLKHPSCSPTSPNGIRKRVDRFQYSVKEYLIWGLADSIK